MTKIMSNLEDDRSFLMKSIEMEFHGHSGMGSCLRRACNIVAWITYK